MTEPSESGTSQAQLEWVQSKQFIIWLVVTVPLFVVIAMALKAVQPGTIVVFVAGILFNEATDPLMEWLQEWQAAEKEVSKHAE